MAWGIALSALALIGMLVLAVAHVRMDEDAPEMPAGAKTGHGNAAKDEVRKAA